MPAITSKSLVEILERVPLLNATQQAALARELLPACSDPQALARQLLQRGWLTPYQLNRVMAGRAGELVVGPYVLLERLGEGGAGEVFKARHQHLGRVVAVKFVRKDALTDKETVGRFLREAHVLAQMEHPNVIQTYDAGPAGNNYFLAMQYVEGTDLQRLVKQGGPLPAERACDYIGQAAAGLQYIHERGMVHRDIKPSNLLVSGGMVSGGVVSGESSRIATHHSTAHHSPLTTHQLVKILDLGLARIQQPIDNPLTGGLTGTGTAIGTLDYMAPEQALDFHTADIRSDIYSLGCTFYFLLAGRAPFEGGSAAQILLAHQQKEPAPIENVRPELFSILRRMTAKAPKARFQTPQQVKDALDSLRDGGPATVRMSVTGPVTRGFDAVRTHALASRRNRPWLLLAGGGAAALLVIGLLVAFAFRSPRPPSSQVAARAATTASRPAALPRTYLLHVDNGERTTDGADQSGQRPTPPLVDCPELGGKALKVAFAPTDYVGVHAASVRNWKQFAALRIDLFNPSKEGVKLVLTIRHARSTDYHTRIDLPLTVDPGKNELRLPLDRMTNVNGSVPDLANVNRWYVANASGKPVTVYLGNVWLEGNSSPLK